ncbi:hypothetical protein MMC2321_02456 [Chitinophaga sp. MM2321]
MILRRERLFKLTNFTEKISQAEIFVILNTDNNRRLFRSLLIGIGLSTPYNLNGLNEELSNFRFLSVQEFYFLRPN